jgi:hypothetical protein
MTFGSNLLHQLGDVVTSREPEGVRALSNLYWRALIMTAVVVLLCVFAYSGWGLLRVLNDLGMTSGTSTSPAPVLSRAALDAVVQGFEERQQQFEALKKNRGAAIPDPR